VWPLPLRHPQLAAASVLQGLLLFLLLLLPLLFHLFCKRKTGFWIGPGWFAYLVYLLSSIFRPIHYWGICKEPTKKVGDPLLQIVITGLNHTTTNTPFFTASQHLTAKILCAKVKIMLDNTVKHIGLLLALPGLCFISVEA
jgi:hypothetical protein